MVLRNLHAKILHRVLPSKKYFQVHETKINAVPDPRDCKSWWRSSTNMGWLQFINIVIIFTLIMLSYLLIMHVAFIQNLTYPVTEFVIAYTVFHNLQSVLSQLKQESISLFCDEKVFDIVPKVILQSAGELKNSKSCRPLSWKSFKRNRFLGCFGQVKSI